MIEINVRPTALATIPAGGPVLFVECSHTYQNSVQSGIQRVVRNVLRHAGEIAGQRGYALVPVVFDGGQFRVAALAGVLDDKLRPLESGTRFEKMRAAWRAWSMLSRRRQVAALALPAYRASRRALAALLPFAPVRRFLFAHPSEFGLAWCIKLPLRALRSRGPVTPTAIVAPLPPGEGFGVSMDSIPDHAGNVLLLLDSSWSLPLWPAVARFQAAGGITHCVIYDLIAITHPANAVRLQFNEYFGWMQAQLAVSRRFVAISRTVAEQLDGYLRQWTQGEQPVRPWSIATFYLGSELDFADPTLAPRPAIRAIFDAAAHVFIVVGSIEPRKNHGFILDAFERHWARGGTAVLVVIGRHGWQNDAVLARMTRHPLAGRQLFLCRDMNDSELDFAYRHASALIIASEAEGFGLPVLCSDIAVFREIADGKARFFSLSDPLCLTEAMESFCADRPVSQRGQRDPQPWLSWRESTGQLLDAVLGGPADGWARVKE
jgi:alpha-1,2-rhamnosyltransferase